MFGKEQIKNDAKKDDFVPTTSEEFIEFKAKEDKVFKQLSELVTKRSLEHFIKKTRVGNKDILEQRIINPKTKEILLYEYFEESVNESRGGN